MQLFICGPSSTHPRSIVLANSRRGFVYHSDVYIAHRTNLVIHRTPFLVSTPPLRRRRRRHYVCMYVCI